MEYSRSLYTIFCLLLAAIGVNTQVSNYDPSNPDRIYFPDYVPQQAALQRQAAGQAPWPGPQPLAFQQAVPVTPLAQPYVPEQVNQWQQTSPRPLPSRQKTVVNTQASQQTLASQQASQQVLANQQANQQALANQRASQQALGIQQPLSDQPNVPDDRNALARERKIIRLDETAVALTNFSIGLMQIVSRQKSGNTVVSPHSIATILALLQQGATGATLEQLTAALRMNQQTSSAAFKVYSDDVQKRNSRNTLRTANNIFLADGFTLNPAFRTAALNVFRSDVTPINFINAVETATEINRWVARNTDNKIQNLVSPDSLSINTQMVLVNAIYFKGLWEMPFRKQVTAPGDFLLTNGNVIRAEFMQTRRFFKTGVDGYTGSKVIILPFAREEYSLMVILPNTITYLSDALSLLTTARLEEYLNFPYMEAKLELPKFSIKADTDLSPILQKMGISKLFSDSELFKVGSFVDNRSPQVSSAVHSAALTIDEEGGSATAASAFAVVALSNDEPSVIFKVNRPFLVVLWDSKANLPLFTAAIENPTL